MVAINIKAYTNSSSQIDELKEFMKKLKIKFEVTEEREETYDPEFVAKIIKGEQDIAEGKGIKMSVDEFLSLCS